MLKTISLVGVVCIAICIPAYGEDCTNVLALSRDLSTSLSDNASVQTAAQQFCSQYKSYLTSHDSTSFGANYLDILSGSYDNSNSNITETASRYCSAADNYNAYSDSYERYIDKIDPGAFGAYDACIKSEERKLAFNAKPESILPDEFSMSVAFTEPGNAKADLVYSSSNSVNCTWSNSHSSNTTIQSPGAVILSCKRGSHSTPSYVRVVRTNGEDDFILPWQAYTDEGTPINILNNYQESLDVLTKKLNIMSASNITRVTNVCNWTQNYQEGCEATCSSGIVVGGTCDIGDNSFGKEVMLLESTDMYGSGKGWHCQYVDYTDGFPSSDHPLNVTIKLRAEAICFDSTK
jgi:hypothetical protein